MAVNFDMQLKALYEDAVKRNMNIEDDIWKKNQTKEEKERERGIFARAGFSASIEDRRGSVSANVLEYYRQKNHMSLEQMNETLFEEPEKLQNAYEEYLSFLDSNPVVSKEDEPEKQLTPEEMDAHLKAQADFYKSWYESYLHKPMEDYLALDEKTMVRKIAVDYSNIINMGQNDDRLVSTYEGAYAKQFGGPELVQDYKEKAAAVQAQIKLAHCMIYDIKQPGVQAAAKYGYEQIRARLEGKRPSDFTKEDTIFCGAFEDFNGRGADLEDTFSEEEIQQYLKGTASEDLKDRMEQQLHTYMEDALETRRGIAAELEQNRKNAKFDSFYEKQKQETADLLTRVEEADQNIWFGSNKYGEMRQALEKVQKLTEAMQRGQEWDTEQMYAYRQALLQVKEKAQEYKTYKGDPKQYKEKTQKRIHVADEIAQFADAQLTEMKELGDQYIQRVTQEEILNMDPGTKYVYRENLYQACKELYDKGRYENFPENWKELNQEADIMKRGGMTGPMLTREDSITANTLEYYRQTHGLTRKELSDVIYNEPDKLQNMLKDYLDFMDKNSVYQDGENPEKQMPSPELTEKIKNQAEFYKKWYQSIADEPIVDYFSQGDEEGIRHLISDEVDAINVSQNEQAIRAKYGKEYAEAFGGLEEMKRLQDEVGVRQKLCHHAMEAYKGKHLETRVAHKLAYDRLLSLVNGRKPSELSEDEQATLLGLDIAPVAGADLKKKFGEKQLNSYLNGVASESLKKEIEAFANEKFQEGKEFGQFNLNESKQKMEQNRAEYQRETCAEQLYDAFTEGIAARNLKQTHESLRTAKVRNEFIQEAMKTNVVTRMVESPDLWPQKATQLVDEMIVEIAQNQKKAYEAEAAQKAAEAERAAQRAAQAQKAQQEQIAPMA